MVVGSIPTRPTNSEERARLLLRGRDCYERGDWDDAFNTLRLADAEGALDAADLHRLAWSAGLTRDEHMLATTEVTAIRRR